MRRIEAHVIFPMYDAHVFLHVVSNATVRAGLKERIRDVARVFGVEKPTTVGYPEAAKHTP